VNYNTVVRNEETLSITGDFRSGFYFENMKKELEELIECKIKEIDLIYVTYMDSDTMHFIKKYDKTREILWDKNSMPYKRYMDKFSPIKDNTGEENGEKSN